MKNFAKIIPIILLLVAIAVPLVSFAEYSVKVGLVPCGSTVSNVPYCNLCYLYILIQNILYFVMLIVAPVVAVLAIGIAGFKILISGANPGLRADGYKIIRTTITGLAIMFAAWVVMNEALLFFTSSQTAGTAKILANPWNEVKCVP